jgi:hypothetical protein
MNITNSLIGKLGVEIDLSDIFSLTVGVESEGDLLTVSNMNININSDNSAQVSANLTYESKSKISNSSENVCFIMKKEKSDWFIQDIKSAQ